MRLRVLARGWSRPLVKLELAAGSSKPTYLNNTHFSGGILANANWFDAIFEFPPTPFPVNHRHETVEGEGNGFGYAIFQPHPEPCWVFAFIGAGGWSAHLFVPWANPALEVHGVLPIGRNWASNHLAKIQL